MPSIVYHRLITYTPTASAEASGYTDDNLALRSVRRPWRSNALSNSPWTIVFNLGSAVATTGIIVWHTNIPASGITVHHSTNGSTWTSFTGTFTVTENAGGRRCLLIPTGIARQYWRLTITAATTSDAANYVKIGRVCIFGATLTLPFTNPLSCRTQYPGTRVDIVNGRRSMAETGEPFAEITLTSSGFPYGTYSYDDLRTALHAGPVALDTECYGSFLVEESDEQFDRTFEELRGNYTFQVREVV